MYSKPNFKSIIVFLFVLFIASLSFFNVGRASTPQPIEPELSIDQWNNRLNQVSTELRQQSDSEQLSTIFKNFHVEVERAIQTATGIGDTNLLEKRMIIYSKMNLLSLNQFSQKNCKINQNNYLKAFNGNRNPAFEDQKLCEWIQTSCNLTSDYCVKAFQTGK